MSKHWFIGLFATIASLGSVSAEETIFDVPALIATPLNPQSLSTSERDGIVTEQVRFHSETDGEKEVDIFAFFSYPKGARNLPAFIWNPGGLGQASPDYTEGPARRGYAVLCIDFPQPGYRSSGDYPINSGLDLPDDPRQAPIYHGAVALLKAVSYLESRAEVDRNRIGMAGSSWGGFFTTLMIGIDPRLKAGSCLYGTGSLQLGNAWWDGVSQNGKNPPTSATRERWRTTLDPAWRLPTKKTPIAWFTGTNDAFYPLSALMQSYEMAVGAKHLCLVPNWDHALPPEITDDQIYVWLDTHLRDQPALAEVSPIVVTNETGRLIATWQFNGTAASADLIASYGESGNWRYRYWHTFPATISGKTCRAELPAAALPCYVSGAVTGANQVRSSTPLALVEPTALGISPVMNLPDFDGCLQWGGFEERQIAYLVRHDRSGQTRWIPRVTNDAKEGQHAAILPAGQIVLPPILNTAGIAHRLTCFMKADKPTTVKLQMAGAEREFSIGTEWTAIAMSATPAQTVMGNFVASITIPAESTVLVDAVEFHPIEERKKD